MYGREIQMKAVREKRMRLRISQRVLSGMMQKLYGLHIRQRSISRFERDGTLEFGTDDRACDMFQSWLGESDQALLEMRMEIRRGTSQKEAEKQAGDVGDSSVSLSRPLIMISVR